jgi:hypothetical protein
MKMKNLIIAILALIAQCGFAQQPNPNVEPSRDINTYLSDQYAGKWEWSLGNSSFTLVLKRNATGLDTYFLHGWYRYIKNGNLIIDQLNKLDSAKYAGLTGFILKGNDTVKISFSEVTRDKLQRGTINFIDGNQSQILIKLKTDEHRESIYIGKRKEYADKLPENLNLKLKRIN